MLQYNWGVRHVNLSADLTKREIECLNWLAHGLRTDQIANQLSISRATVDFHLANARKKLAASTREQAVALAVAGKFIDPTK